MARFIRLCSFVLSAFFASQFISVSQADETGAPVSILDLWLNAAPADLLVEEIAEITGRESAIDGNLNVRVSGRYTGSAHSILDAVAREHAVLFDIDDSTISAVPDALRTVSSVIADEKPLDVAVRESITTRLLSGNSVEFTDNGIVVTGHPRFVNRTARELSSALADQGRVNNSVEELADEKSELSTQTSLATMTAIDKAQPVTDAAAVVVLSDIKQTTDAVSDGQVAASVSDITGNDTNRTLTDVPGDARQTTVAILESADNQADVVRVDEDPGVQTARSSGSGISVPGDDDVFATEAAQDEMSKASPETSPAPRVYRWVTDIPGFDTF